MRTTTAPRTASDSRPAAIGRAARATGAGRRATRTARNTRKARAARAGLPALTTMLLLAALAATAAGAPAVAAAAAEDARKERVLTDSRISESSGLAASARHPGVLYTHNDSGDDPRVYAVGPDGDVVAALTLAGVTARDWEGIATGRGEDGEPALFVGDIGDNLGGAWPSISVYRIAEPGELRDATVKATRYRLRYADGARDAEALLVDPRTNRLYVVSKQDSGGGLYAAPERLRTDRVNVLRRVARVPPAVTDGAFSPDGGTFVLRDYVTAHVYAAPGKRLGTVTLPLQLQGESITYDREGGGLLTGSEGAGSRVWQVPLPADLAPPPTEAGRSGDGRGRSPGAAGGGGGAAGGGAEGIGAPRGRDLTLLLGGAAVVLLLVVVSRRFAR